MDIRLVAPLAVWVMWKNIINLKKRKKSKPNLSKVEASFSLILNKLNRIL